MRLWALFPNEISIWISIHPMWVSIIQSIEGLNNSRTKGREKGGIHLASYLTVWDGPSHLLSSVWDLHYQSPDSQAFQLRLNYTTSFPGSLVYRQHIVGLLSLICVSQFLITNLSIYVHIYTYMAFILFLWKNHNLISNDEMNNFKAPIMDQVLLLGFSVCSVQSVIYWVTIWMPSICHAVC